MLLYTTIMSPRYFLARHELPVVAMFAVLPALTIASPIVVFAEHRHCHGSAICPGQPLGVTRRFAKVVCTVISAPMKYGEAIIVDHLNSAETDQSQLVIYDREIEVRLLYRDPDSGAEHYLIRYPAALKVRAHRHTAAQTIVVLEGRLAVNDEVVGPGAFCHFPPGETMFHAPADDEPCLFVSIFHGPADVEPLDR